MLKQWKKMKNKIWTIDDDDYYYYLITNSLL